MSCSVNVVIEVLEIQQNKIQAAPVEALCMT